MSSHYHQWRCRVKPGQQPESIATAQRNTGPDEAEWAGIAGNSREQGNCGFGQSFPREFDCKQEETEALELDKLDGATLVLGFEEIKTANGGRLNFRGAD